MKCMAIDYYGRGRFLDVGPARWDDVQRWALSTELVEEIDWAGYTAIYAVTCTHGGKHYFILGELPDEGVAAVSSNGSGSEQGGSHEVCSDGVVSAWSGGAATRGAPMPLLDDGEAV